MYRSSGLQQDSNGNHYMQITEIATGKIKRVEIHQMPVSTTMEEVILDNNSVNSHRWKFFSEDKEYIPSVCGVFGCACCDSSNLQARLDEFRASMN